jgi:hypothetical protein
MVNYDTDLRYLFQSNEAKRPYYVDNNIIELTKDSVFDSDINIDGFLKNVSSIAINQQDVMVVANFIGKLTNTQNATAPTVSSTVPPNSSVSFEDNAMNNDVYITVTRANNISEDMLQKIVTEIVSSTIVVDIAKNHIAFRDFLYDIIEDTSKFIFMQAGTKLYEFINSLPSSDSRYLFLGDPASQFSNLRSGRNSTLMAQLKAACIEAMKEVFVQSPTSITSLDMKDMGIGSTKYTRKFYFDLRDKMTAKLNVSQIYSNVNTNQILYFKKVAVELFLKTAFPCVHMIYLQTLISYYGDKGDFVNVRIMMLASIYYVFYTLKRIVTISNTLPNTSLGKITTVQASRLNTIIQILNDYLTNNNKIRVDSTSTPNEEMKKLIIELHDLSRDVTNSNGVIQGLKRSIMNQQLAMRNMLFNLEVIRNRYWWATFEFWTVFSLLVVFVIAMSIMLVLAEVLKKPNLINWVQYICGFIAIGVIVLKVLLMIIYFMKGTNK